MKRAAFLEGDREMEDSHNIAASFGDTEVNISSVIVGWMFA